MNKYLFAGSLTLVLVLTPLSALAAPSERAQEARAQAQTKRADIQEKVEERRAEIQQKVEERRAQVKQRVCERREENLQRVIPKLSQGAISVKSAIDTVYERVQGFYENNQLTVENYDELKADVDEKQAEAQAAIEVLNDYEFELDCENQNAGEQLDSFRTAVHEARDELKEYRDALVVLISSMRAEEAEENADNESEGEEVEGESENESKDEESSENEVNETEGESNE